MANFEARQWGEVSVSERHSHPNREARQPLQVDIDCEPHRFLPQPNDVPTKSYPSYPSYPKTRDSISYSLEVTYANTSNHGVR